MKLREFSDEDITMHALSMGGRNIRNVIADITTDYGNLLIKYKTLPTHRTLASVMASDVGSLIDRIVDIHQKCTESGDDAETHAAATLLKTMYSELTKILDLVK